MTTPSDSLSPARIEWRDDAPFNIDAGDWYSSNAGALAEAEHVFIDGNALPARWDAAPRIGELGFGTGLNFLACVRQWLQQPGEGWLHYTAVERAPLRPDDHRRALARWPELQPLGTELLAQMPPPQRGFHLLVFPRWRTRLLLLLDEAAAALPRLEATIDAWFLDGFAPARNPDLWDDALWAEVRRLSATGTTFATYSAAGHVRRGLSAHGFEVHKRPGFGRKREMLHGRLPTGDPQSALPPWFARPAMRPPGRVAVLGAGLTGCAVAHGLAQAGLQVQLIDAAAGPAQGASAMPAMLARPYPERKPSVRESLYAGAAAFARRQLAGLPGWTPTPIDLADDLGVDGAIVEPGALCAHWVAHPSITLRAASKAERLDRDTHGWRIMTTAGAIEADTVVLATANATALCDAIPATRPVRGQLAHWSDTSPPLRPRCDHGHVIPWQGGVVAGATYRRGSLDLRASDEDNTELAELVARLIPGARPDPRQARAHVGIRHTCTDRLPMIGPIPEAAAWCDVYAQLHHRPGRDQWPAAPLQAGLWCSLGHGSRGATLAALQAEILVAGILGWPMPVPAELIAALHPGRFLLRDLKRGRAGVSPRCAPESG